jgi:hypothetical protein
MSETAEGKRLDDSREQNIAWKKWGHYLSERQWGRRLKRHSFGPVLDLL